MDSLRRNGVCRLRRLAPQGLHVGRRWRPDAGLTVERVPRADVITLRMSVDEALKYIISMGVVAPPMPAAIAHASPARV